MLKDSLISLSRRDFLKVAGVGVAGTLLGCAPRPVQEVIETLTPLPTITPTPTLIFSPTSQAIEATATVAPTMTAIPTMTMFPEQGSLLGFLSTQEKSDYPAGMNLMGNELSGVNEITKDSKDRFHDYWNSRVETNSDDYKRIQKLDRMFGQLSLPVGDITDRRLDFDWETEKHPQQGLGFTAEDLDVLRTLKDMQKVQGTGAYISRNDNNEIDYNRAWTIAPARDLETAVLAYVDEFIKLNPSKESQRQSLFEQIIYGDLGIKAKDDDGRWQTIADNFYTCETYSKDAGVRSEQAEGVRAMEFDPEQEILYDKKEQEEIKIHDSRNSVLVVMVADSQHLRVEVYDLSNPPDPLSPSLDPDIPEMDPVRVMGSRLLPCGVGAPAPGKTEQPPEKTPPPQQYPTPVPTNPHIIPTATPGPPPTPESTATNIP